MKALEPESEDFWKWVPDVAFDMSYDVKLVIPS
jgi:hypothetical protein